MILLSTRWRQKPARPEQVNPVLCSSTDQRVYIREIDEDFLSNWLKALDSLLGTVWSTQRAYPDGSARPELHTVQCPCTVCPV